MSFRKGLRTVATATLVLSGMLFAGLAAAPAGAATPAHGNPTLVTASSHVGASRTAPQHVTLRGTAANGAQIVCQLTVSDVGQNTDGTATVQAIVGCAAPVQEIDLDVAIASQTALVADTGFTSAFATSNYSNTVETASCVSGILQGTASARIVFGSGTPVVMTTSTNGRLASLHC